MLDDWPNSLSPLAIRLCLRQTHRHPAQKPALFCSLSSFSVCFDLLLLRCVSIPRLIRTIDVSTFHRYPLPRGNARPAAEQLPSPDSFPVIEPELWFSDIFLNEVPPASLATLHYVRQMFNERRFESNRLGSATLKLLRMRRIRGLSTSSIRTLREWTDRSRFELFLLSMLLLGCLLLPRV